MPAKVQSNSWGRLFGGGIADAYRHANQGWDVVMSTPETLYFDMPYAADGWERGTDWASRATDLYKVFSFMPENLGANAAIMTDRPRQGRHDRRYRAAGRGTPHHRHAGPAVERDRQKPADRRLHAVSPHPGAGGTRLAPGGLGA